MTHDPGGKVRIALPPGTTASAIFDGVNQEWRYRLTRMWNGAADASTTCMFVMMNPSTADQNVDDPTVAKCGRLARRWGYHALSVCNVFAYRATDQAQLARVPDPIGPLNDLWIARTAERAGLIVMAYGTPKTKALQARGPTVARMLLARGFKLHVLRLSTAGVPVHPLYQPEGLPPIPWEGPPA